MQLVVSLHRNHSNSYLAFSTTIVLFQAVGLVCFLIGFVAVLCIGNYYRAKRAMERQKQKRLARLSGHAGNGVVGLESPRSDHSTASTQFNEEHQTLLMGSRINNPQTRRRNVEEPTDSLLLDVDDTGPRAKLTSI